MASKLVTLGGAALALLMVSGFPVLTDARQGGGGGGHGFGGHGFSGGHMGGMAVGGAHMGAPAHVVPGGAHFVHRPFFHDRRIHRRVFFVAPGYGAYYYSDGCYWLRQNALSTGNPYWWNRYYACVYGNGY